MRHILLSFALLLLLPQSAISKITESELSKLESLRIKAMFASAIDSTDLETLSIPGFILNGEKIAAQIRHDNMNLEYSSMPKLFSSLTDKYKAEKLTDSDGYRGLLIASSLMANYSYDYEIADKLLEELEENIAKYVKDPIKRQAWTLLRNTHTTSFIDPQWTIQQNATSRRHLTSQNPDLGRELRLSLAIAELNDIITFTSYATAVEASQLIQRIKQNLLEFNESDFLAKNLEPDFLLATIISDYDNSLLPQIRLKRLLERKDIAAYSKANYQVCLGNILHFNGDIEGRSILTQTIKTLESLALNEEKPSEILASYVTLQLLMHENDNFGIITEYNNDSTDVQLYNSTMQHLGNDVQSNRCKASIIEAFGNARIGQSSTLPLTRTATDFLNAVKDDPYLPYRIPAIINAASKIANAGKLTEALAMIDIDNSSSCLLPKDISDIQKANVYRTLAEIYSYIRDFEMSYNYTSKALVLSEREYSGNNIYLFDVTYGAFQTARFLGKPETSALMSKLESIRTTLPDKPWEHEADWSIAFQKANDAKSRRQYFQQIKAIYNLAKEKKIPIFQRDACVSLANTYAQDNNMKEAGKWYDEAYELSKNLPIDISFINEYLDFLYNAVSDRAKWYKTFNRSLFEIEKNRMDLNCGFLDLLSSQTTNVLHSGNIEDYVFLWSIFQNRVQTLLPLATDIYAAAAILNPIIDVLAVLLIKSYSYSPNLTEKQKEELNGNTKQLIQLIDNILDNKNTLNLAFAQEMQLEIKKAQIFIAANDISAAQTHLTRAKEIAIAHGNEESFDIISFWLRVDLAQITNNTTELEQLLSSPRVQDIISYGNIETIQNTYALLYKLKSSQGKYNDALRFASKRYEIMQQFIAEQFFDMGETHKEALIDNGYATPWDAYALLSSTSNPEVRKLAYNETIFYRNLLLESSESMQRAIYASNDSIAINRYQQLVALRKDKESIKFDFSDPESQRKITDISRKIYELEDSISEICAHHGTVSRRRMTLYSHIARALDKDEAAIEFISNGENFGALILKHKSKAPIYIELAKGSDIAECIKPLHSIGKLNTRIKNIYDSKYNGSKLYDCIWAPIDKELNGINKIYYSTSGYLSTISFAALQDTTGTSLCERYDLRLLTTTSMLPEIKQNDINPNHSNDTGLNMVAFGAIPYDIEEGPIPDREFKYLKGSEPELAIIDSICKANNIDIQCIVSTEATEDRFRGLSGSTPPILLLSTHGYYLNNMTAAKHAYYINKGLTSDETPEQYNMNIPALMRGGLAFAGANTVWNNNGEKEDDQDGILTGLEISQLDLSKNKLLILSACETGLGETTTQEGVNGLQRGFKQAGVQTIIMTLWEANDSRTKRFMQIFFETLFATSDRHQAFRTAQLTLKKESRAIGYWAPFIMLD